MPAMDNTFDSFIFFARPQRLAAQRTARRFERNYMVAHDGFHSTRVLLG